MNDRSTGFDVSNRFFYLLIVFVAAMSLFWMFRMYEIWNSSQGNWAREISVEGTGTAYVVPDTAVVRLGVTTDADTSEEAVSGNSEKMTKIMAALKELGIEDKDIKTVDYYLSPSYIWTEGQGDKLTGYQLSNTVEVKLKDFDKVNDLITQASAAGANTVSGVEFTVDDPDAAKAEAREEAIASAKEKAELISKQSGLRLGHMVNYWEYSNDYYGGKGGGEMYMEEITAESSPSITPGEQEITLTVTLSYQLR